MSDSIIISETIEVRFYDVEERLIALLFDPASEVAAVWREDTNVWSKLGGGWFDKAAMTPGAGRSTDRAAAEWPDAFASKGYQSLAAVLGTDLPDEEDESPREKRHVAIKSVNSEKQIAYGEVYAPNVLDTYGEFMTAEDIETMAHRFMQLDLRTVIDTEHNNIPNGAYPVESFIAREGDPDYTPGAWVLGVHIPNDGLWRKVKSGELNGFSFQSLVNPASAEVCYSVTRDQVGKTQPQSDHDHTYFVQLDEMGRVVGGVTSKAADGHFHEITRASHTGTANDHTHRFFL